MNIEEFVNDYLQEHRHEVLLNPYNGLVEFAEALKAEALKEAVECELYWDGWDGDFLAIDLNMAALGYSEGDKVRIIIVKEN